VIDEALSRDWLCYRVPFYMRAPKGYDTACACALIRRCRGRVARSTPRLLPVLAASAVDFFYFNHLKKSKKLTRTKLIYKFCPLTSRIGQIVTTYKRVTSVQML
jgi:hypothetical protein